MPTESVVSSADLGPETPFVAVRPVVLSAPERGTELELRATAPAEGTELPIVVFSHGFAEYMDSYAPLCEFWASHGFVVLQPAHLDCQRYGLAPTDPRFPEIWRYRIGDLTRVLDGLNEIESSVPELSGRLDRSRVAVAGHSWGATTASALIGARIIGSDDRVGESMLDERIRAGVLFAVAGAGGENLTPFAAKHFSFMNPDFTAMSPPALIVAGDRDQSPLSTRGPDWWTDAYAQSPSQKALLTLVGAEHTMGGIAGYSTHEISDWNLDRIALLQQVSTAYLLDVLDVDSGVAWARASEALSSSREEGHLQTKQAPVTSRSPGGQGPRSPRRFLPAARPSWSRSGQRSAGTRLPARRGRAASRYREFKLPHSTPGRGDDAMGFDQYHEPPEELPAPTRTFARLCASLTEEAEAIGWYEQRLALETDPEAAAVMRDAVGEEYKHFAMDLEFLLRRTPKWRETARGILFQDGDIVEHGEAAEEAAGEDASLADAPGTAPTGAPDGSGGLGIGSLKGGSL